MRFVFPFLFLVLFSVTPTHAAAVPQKLGKFGYWSAYTITEQGQPVCYMTLTAKPPPDKSKKAKKTKRGDITIMITHRMQEGSINVFSYSAGTKLKSATEAVITIDKVKFDLFTQDDTAWSRDAQTDRALALAIRKGGTLTFTGLNAKGEKLGDVINLKGAGQAYQAISKPCGVVAPEASRPPAKGAVKSPTKSKSPAKAMISDKKKHK